MQFGFSQTKLSPDEENSELLLNLTCELPQETLIRLAIKNHEIRSKVIVFQSFPKKQNVRFYELIYQKISQRIL